VCFLRIVMFVPRLSLSLNRARRSGAGDALARALVRTASLTAGAHRRASCFVKQMTGPQCARGKLNCWCPKLYKLLRQTNDWSTATTFQSLARAQRTVLYLGAWPGGAAHGDGPRESDDDRGRWFRTSHLPFSLEARRRHATFEPPPHTTTTNPFPASFDQTQRAPTTPRHLSV